MSDWNEELPKFKARRMGQDETSRPTGGRNRKRKPWKVMLSPIHPEGDDKMVYRGTSREACELWIDKENRSGGWMPYRTAPMVYKEAMQVRHQARVRRYKIVGPDAPTPT